MKGRFVNREMLSCRFSCAACATVDAPVLVPSRVEDEDVVTWMEKTCIVAVWREHRRISPLCPAQVLTEMKIPHQGGGRVGDPRVQ